MKKNDNKGSTFILVIIALALVTIFTGIIFTQINQQIKSNYDLSVDVHLKYAAESGIENTISKVIEEIEYKLNKYIETPKDKKDSNIFVEVPDNTYLFDDGYGFIVKDVPKAPIEISSINDKLIGAKDIVMNIVSTGMYKGDKYKIEAEVTFKTKVMPNGKFEMRYFVNTYKNI